MAYSPIDISLIKIFWKKNLTQGCIFQNWKTLYEMPKGAISINGSAIWDAISGSYWHTASFSKENVEIIGHIPTLENVFQLAEEKWYFYSIAFQWLQGYTLSLYNELATQKFIPYNPTKPLIKQEDSAKEQLVVLFS